jgi:hypothetical protein
MNEIIIAYHIFYNLKELIVRCSSVALLLSTIMLYTQDGSLDDAMSHYRQTPFIAIGDMYRSAI